MISSIVFLIIGLVLLVFSADFLVRGASRLACAMGISPLVIGLTVVAYGTSAPELSVSVMSAFKGQADIALGNVVGSNIFNVLGILGISAIIIPLVVHRQLVRFDVPVMIGFSADAHDHGLGRGDQPFGRPGAFRRGHLVHCVLIRSEPQGVEGGRRDDGGGQREIQGYVLEGVGDKHRLHPAGTGWPDARLQVAGRWRGDDRAAFRGVGVGDRIDDRLRRHLASGGGDLGGRGLEGRAGHRRRQCGRQQYFQHRQRARPGIHRLAEWHRSRHVRPALSTSR